MKLLCLCTALAVMLQVAPPQEKAPTRTPPRADACDMKTIVKANWCSRDKAFIEKRALVSNAVYYACPVDKIVASEPGKCTKCGKELEKQTSGADACPTCFGKTELVDACEKTFWECPKCKAHSMKEGDCEKDKVAMERQVSLAPIGYKCEGCGYASDKAGNCPKASAKECPNFGKPLTKACTKSGQFPHVSGAKASG